MKRTRGERDISEVFKKKRGRVTLDIKKLKPNNIKMREPERQRNRKKEAHRANSAVEMLDLSQY